MQFITEYANDADDGAPYAGPLLLADSWVAATALLAHVRGPNGEPLLLLGELVDRMDASLHGDTKTWVRRRED